MAVEQAVHKFIARSHIFNAVVTCTSKATAFTVPVKKLYDHGAQHSSPTKSKMEKPFVKLTPAIDGIQNKDKYRIPAEKVDSRPQTSIPTDISDDKNVNSKSYSTSTSSQRSNTGRYGSHQREERVGRLSSRCYPICSTLPALTEEDYKYCLNVSVTLNKTSKNAIEICSYCVIHISLRYDDDFATKIEGSDKEGCCPDEVPGSQ